jgi:hypothetical protein
VIVVLVGGVFAYLKFGPKTDNQTPLSTEFVNTEEFIDINEDSDNETVYSNCPTESEEKEFKPKSDQPLKPKQENLPNEVGGPSAHDIYRLTSTDQTNFYAENELLLSSSSVPDGVKTADGRELVYFITGRTVNDHGMRVAERQADGLLKVLNCVTFDGAFDGSAVDPNVVLLSDGRLRMTYLSNFEEAEKDRIINSAVSTDGINFVVEKAILTGSNYSDPTETVLSDGNFLLGITGIGDNLDLYISSDGKNFQKQGSFRNEGGGFGDLITMPDGSVRFYAGGDALRMHESKDAGKTWSRGSVVVSGQSSDQHGVGMPSVLFNGSEMEIYYISSRGKNK